MIRSNMPEIMMSVHPRWIELIKTIIGQKDGKPLYKKRYEIRKKRPKQEPPYRCFLYETIAKGGCGKVVGEFVCDQVVEFESEFVDDDCYESIGVVWYDEDDGEREVSIFTDNGDANFLNNKLCEESCVPLNELRRYVGVGINTFYGWRISDLKIYDTPRELTEFARVGVCFEKWQTFFPAGSLMATRENFDKVNLLHHPPLSWQFVREVQHEE